MLHLVGSRRARGREHEPVPDPAIPDAPECLGGVARAAWDELAPQHARRRTLTRIDRWALARYCTMFEHWFDAQQFIAKNGKTYPVRDENGRVKIVRRYPHTDIAAEAARQMGRLESEFGMTPASRPRVPAAPIRREDSLEQFIAEGRRGPHVQ
jgi:P27 family predicted phage terminase small subunit